MGIRREQKFFSGVLFLQHYVREEKIRGLETCNIREAPFKMGLSAGIEKTNRTYSCMRAKKDD